MLYQNFMFLLLLQKLQKIGMVWFWQKKGANMQLARNPRNYLLSFGSADAHWKWDFNSILFKGAGAQIHVQGCTWLVHTFRIEWKPFSHSTRASFDTDPKGLRKIGFIPPIFWAWDYQSDPRWKCLHSIFLSQNVIPPAAFLWIQTEWVFQFKVSLSSIYANPMEPSRYDPVFV